MKRLTHIDENNRPRMVDISDKPLSYRVARASGFIRLQPETLRLVSANRMKKGNVLLTAELAGVQASKRTPGLIPLCHLVQLLHVRVKATLGQTGVTVESDVRCVDRTGAEMEALTAVSIALLTVYDMCKAVDPSMTISKIRLIQKMKQPWTEIPPAGSLSPSESRPTGNKHPRERNRR